jgi:hypothetical protein|uniref:hypothetical protein n=2 Tax=Candidatus Limnocylindrus sp. TaxID=2802978 RepID=UPI00404ACE9B
MMSSKSTESKAPSKKTGALRRASGFFYAKSTLVTALLTTVIFAGYTVLILSAQGKTFEVANSSIRSLGTSLGFGQAEVLAFLAERSAEQISAYITFSQVWDSLFGVIYGVMYVVWVSLLFKPYSLKVGLLNLLPFGQVLLDWLENFSLASLSNQYLADGTIASSTALLASTASSIKWVFALLVYGVILVGIVARIVGALKRRSQR